jgi:hypothetical protein
MSLQFTTANQHIEAGGVKCCVYGGAGMGKTVLLATAPNPLLLAAEAGMLSLRKQNLERLFGVGNPAITYDMPTILIRNIDDLNAAYEFVRANPHAQGFKTIGLDSLSEIAEVVLNAAKKTVKDPRQAYGELIEKMETLIRGFVSLHNKNIVMIAKMEPSKDELTGVVKYGPSMPGSKLGVKLPYMFDEVFRLGINKTPQGESYRFLQTQPDIQFEAKDRSGALAAIEPPNLAQVFAKILGS